MESGDIVNVDAVRFINGSQNRLKGVLFGIADNARGGNVNLHAGKVSHLYGLLIGRGRQSLVPVGITAEEYGISTGGDCRPQHLQHINVDGQCGIFGNSNVRRQINLAEIFIIFWRGSPVPHSIKQNALKLLGCPSAGIINHADGDHNIIVNVSTQAHQVEGGIAQTADLLGHNAHIRRPILGSLNDVVSLHLNVVPITVIKGYSQGERLAQLGNGLKSHGNFSDRCGTCEEFLGVGGEFSIKDFENSVIRPDAADVLLRLDCAGVGVESEVIDGDCHPPADLHPYLKLISGGDFFGGLD